MNNASQTSRRGRFAAAASICLAALTGIGSLVATSGTASAAPASTARASYVQYGYTVVPDPYPAKVIDAIYTSNLLVAVSGGSTSQGAPIIQWGQDNGAEQRWYFDSVYDSSGTYVGMLIRNQNSGMCLNTDGVAGDQLFQWPCIAAQYTQLFVEEVHQYGNLICDKFVNQFNGDLLDVYGDSYSWGGAIDLWPRKGTQASNQCFVANSN